MSFWTTARSGCSSCEARRSRRPSRPLQFFGSAMMPPNYSRSQIIKELAPRRLEKTTILASARNGAAGIMSGSASFSCDLLTALLGHVPRQDGWQRGVIADARPTPRRATHCPACLYRRVVWVV